MADVRGGISQMEERAAYPWRFDLATISMAQLLS